MMRSVFVLAMCLTSTSSLRIAIDTDPSSPLEKNTAQLMSIPGYTGGWVSGPRGVKGSFSKVKWTPPAGCAEAIMANTACMARPEIQACMYSGDCDAVADTPPAVCQTQEIYTACGGEASGTGDPHAVNMLGEKFDINKLGHQVLVKYPRHSESDAKLIIRTDIQRLGTGCHQTFMKGMNISGAWVKKDMIFRAAEDRSSLEAFVDGQWVDSTMGSELLRDIEQQPAKKGESLLLNFDPVTVRIFARAAPRHPEWHFLNIDVKGLAKLGDQVGGLLGMDDHQQVQKGEENCGKAAVKYAKSVPTMSLNVTTDTDASDSERFFIARAE